MEYVIAEVVVSIHYPTVSAFFITNILDDQDVNEFRVQQQFGSICLCVLHDYVTVT